MRAKKETHSKKWSARLGPASHWWNIEILMDANQIGISQWNNRCVYCGSNPFCLRVVSFKNTTRWWSIMESEKMKEPRNSRAFSWLYHFCNAIIENSSTINAKDYSCAIFDMSLNHPRTSSSGSLSCSNCIVIFDAQRLFNFFFTVSGLYPSGLLARIVLEISVETSIVSSISICTPKTSLTMSLWIYFTKSKGRHRRIRKSCNCTRKYPPADTRHYAWNNQCISHNSETDKAHAEQNQ